MSKPTQYSRQGDSESLNESTAVGGNQVAKLSEFIADLIAPFSIHRKKYARPHGTVARRQFANRTEKRLTYLLEQARREGYNAGHAQGLATGSLRGEEQVNDLVATDREASDV